MGIKRSLFDWFFMGKLLLETEPSKEKISFKNYVPAAHWCNNFSKEKMEVKGYETLSLPPSRNARIT